MTTQFFQGYTLINDVIYHVASHRNNEFSAKFGEVDEDFFMYETPEMALTAVERFLNKVIHNQSAPKMFRKVAEQKLAKLDNSGKNAWDMVVEF